MRRFLQLNPFLALGVLGALLMGLWIALDLSLDAGVGRWLFITWRTLAAPIHLATNVVGRYTETWPDALDALAALAVGILPYLAADWMIRRRNLLLSGIVAGAVATVLFTGLHHATISDIWFAAVPMVIAGSACGFCLAWTYRRLFATPSVRSWIAFNTSFIALYAMLGALSMLLFQPMASAAELIAASGPPPRELFARAMPLTVTTAVAAVGLMWWCWGRTAMDAVALAVTHTVLMALLGLNVSVIGLFSWTSDAAIVLAGFFGLVIALAAGYAAVVIAIERRRHFGGASLTSAP